MISIRYGFTKRASAGDLERAEEVLTTKKHWLRYPGDKNLGYQLTGCLEMAYLAAAGTQLWCMSEIYA
jgi:hypothetical protein